MSLLIDCGNTRCKITWLLADGSLAPVVALDLDAADFIAQLKTRLQNNIECKSCYFASVAKAELRPLLNHN